MGLNFYGNQTVHADSKIQINPRWMAGKSQIGIKNNRATEATRGVYHERWQIERLIKKGYAVATAYCGDIDPDNYQHDFTDGIHPLFYRDDQSKPDPGEWGTIGAWAWGLSRMLDYLIESESAINAKQVAVIGHSRLGKTALWAGAQDQRFGLVISNNSGCGGAALYRREFGERIHHMIKPVGFDPNKKYPLLLANYGGPATNAFRETFTLPSTLTEYGFLVANIDGRNVRGRGKELLDQLYGNLSIVEQDDFAEGIKSLYNRPYFDKDNVGVYGTSYGGTTAATSLLRFPDVYHAAVANSAVTDSRNYDTIYTERFMNLITNNKEGYDAASLMTYAKDLQGELMIYFGTSDNNVHPSNSLQFIKALQDAGKSFEVQIGPDRGHTAMNRDRMMEFFIEHLVVN